MRLRVVFLCSLVLVLAVLLGFCSVGNVEGVVFYSPISPIPYIGPIDTPHGFLKSTVFPYHSSEHDPEVGSVSDADINNVVSMTSSVMCLVYRRMRVELRDSVYMR